MTAYVSITEKILATPSKLAQRIRQCGLADAVGWCFYQTQWRWRKSGKGVQLSEFAHQVIVEDDVNHHGYEPIDSLCFDKVLEYFQPIGSKDGFLDYDCGMGRAVILATMQPYGRVLGVELDARLVQSVNQQIKPVRGRGRIRVDRRRGQNAVQWRKRLCPQPRRLPPMATCLASV